MTLRYALLALPFVVAACDTARPVNDARPAMRPGAEAREAAAAEAAARLNAEAAAEAAAAEATPDSAITTAALDDDDVFPEVPLTPNAAPNATPVAVPPPAAAAPQGPVGAFPEGLSVPAQVASRLPPGVDRSTLLQDQNGCFTYTVGFEIVPVVDPSGAPVCIR
ncbi:MAG: hypothetical protein ACU0DW_04215 [Shimia sp.]